MNFDGLKKVANTKDIVKLATLELNKKYIIYGVLAKQTSLGRAVLVDLGDFCSWLPKRFISFFTDEAIDDANKNYSGKMYLLIKEIKLILNNPSPIIEIDKL